MELTVDQSLQLGIAAHNAGNVQEAERLYRAVLQSEPTHPQANYSLGLIAISLGKSATALALFKAALDVNPSIEKFWVSYIDVLIKECQFKDAKRFIKKAKKAGFVGQNFKALGEQATRAIQSHGKGDLVRLKSPREEDISRMVSSYQNGQYEMAQDLALSMSKQFPDYSLCWKVLGAVFSITGQMEEALLAHINSVRLDPKDAEAHNNMSVTLKSLGRLDESQESCMRALAIRPDFVECHNNLGNVLKALGRLEAAEASYKKAIAVNPDYAEAHSNLGNTLAELGRLDEAETSLRQAIALRPDSAEAHISLGFTLQELGRFGEAETSYRQTIALQPDYAEAYYNLGATHLMQGNMGKGFHFYEWRLKLKQPTEAPARSHLMWDGEKSLSGKHFVIYEEQALGDIIQFCRYLPLLEQKGAVVTFKVKSILHALLQTMDSNTSLVTSLPEENQIDFETPLVSLPLLLNTTLETIPATNPYLFADQERIQTWGERFSLDRFKIGICWQGSTWKNAVGRSFPVSLFEGISRIPNVELISLHKGEGEAQMAGIEFDVTTLGHDFDAGQDAFLDTAAVMMNCNLIITACTSVAHLAGAIGRPTWVALKQTPDWRWMLDRPDSPWYPTITLYRQESRGDWVDVFETIERDLRSLLQQKKEAQ